MYELRSAPARRARMTGERPRLRVHVLRPERTTVPRYETEHAAGLDLAAAIDAPWTLSPGERAQVPTGLAVAIPPGYEGQVRPRSGLAARAGITLVNAPGTIDADYRGEVQVLLINLGHEPFPIEPGARIAQLVIAPVVQVTVEPVQDAQQLGTTRRGQGGFGSTG